MVQRFVSQLLAVALALHSSVWTAESSSFGDSPYTPVGDRVALDTNHPAIGAELPSTSVAFRPVERTPPDSLAELLTAAAAAATKTESNTTTGIAPIGRNRESGGSVTSEDLVRLEAYFKTPMEYSFSALPKRGAIDPIPWPSSYWPVFQDSINYKWDKRQASPAEKYARAFQHDVKKFMNRVSEVNGVDSQKTKKACSSDWECMWAGDGSQCAKRDGAKRGYCIPAWFGICHAWAPAALLEPEPRCSVTKNGVTFEPVDIKALVSMTYDGAHVDTVFTGTRFNGNDNEKNNKDQYGRYKDTTRRDLGAGFFHIATANMLGTFQHSFIVDVTAGAQVWNQPVRSYEVLEAKPIDMAQAGRQYFKTNSYPFNSAAASLMLVKTRFQWIVESSENGPLVRTGKVDKSTKSADYTYILELDDSGLIIGGEWVGASQDNHVDFLWFPVAKPALDTVTDVGINYAEVTELLDASVNGRC